MYSYQYPNTYVVSFEYNKQKVYACKFNQAV